jgi:cytochrome c biogenesis protein CcmG, thiol:disulfide interchange protein DsbE
MAVNWTGRRVSGAVAALISCLPLIASPAGSDPTLSLGRIAPPLTALQFDGQRFDLGSLRGQVVVLNFWASWCSPCRAEMPALDALDREYRDQGVVVVGLSVDDRHDRRDALKAARGLGYRLGLASDAPVNGFGPAREIPLTYLIGRDGSIKAILRANRGALSTAELRSEIERELAAGVR